MYQCKTSDESIEELMKDGNGNDTEEQGRDSGDSTTQNFIKKVRFESERGGPHGLEWGLYERSQDDIVIGKKSQVA